AMEHYARGIEIATEVLGAEHPSVLSTRQNRMGLMWRHQLRGEALTEGNEVLAAQSRVLGPRHPDLVFTLGNLAVMANDTAAYDKAQGFSERALAIAGDTTLAASATMVPLLQLATAAGYLGKLDLAFEHGNAALALSERTLGIEHVTTAEALNVLGMLHAQRRDIDAARREYARARKIFAANGLPIRVAQTDGALAFVEYRSANPDLALTLAHAAADRLQSLDPGGRDLAHALLIAGSIEGTQGRPESAALARARVLYEALGLPLPDLDAP
ncbi:MAG: tetratricopeptide repeat protein, partial [Nannocystaceae bacterium]|nr:tetratricopeptide repeat protein [Nannocystaceae bacterium]